jgi:hypothetical protein
MNHPRFLSAAAHELGERMENFSWILYQLEVAFLSTILTGYRKPVVILLSLKPRRTNPYLFFSEKKNNCKFPTRT